MPRNWTVTSVFNGDRVASADSTKRRLDAFLLGQRTEAFHDFGIRVEDCEDLRDLRMPLAV